jgi:hypothetical protein
MEKLTELKKHLTELAEMKIRCDDEDFDLYDCSGGNIDDAYVMGSDHKEVLLARELLSKYF